MRKIGFRDATKVVKVKYDALSLMVAVAVSLVNPGQYQNRVSGKSKYSFNVNTVMT